MRPLAFVLWLLSASVLADTIHGRVVGIQDGETLTLLAPGNV